MSDLSGRIASLSPAQRAELQQRLRERRQDGARAEEPAPERAEPALPPASELGFSIFFFSADGSRAGAHKYRLVRESAQLADRAGFEAVWIPERHFDPFGGLYPSPSVLAAALATTTERIAIRAGSVVLPLEHPVRVAEEWSVVDNLSGGRVGVSFASGWHPNDFVLATDRWEERRDLVFEGIDVIRRLWAGESVRLPGGTGAPTDIRIYPQPIQRELPIWVTSASTAATWVRAAEVGANVLTALLEQTVEEAAEKIELYRKTLAESGFDPASRRVTMMLHTFVGDSVEEVRRIVRPPMSTYLRSHIGLYEKLARSQDIKVDVDSFTEADKEALVAYAFERYFGANALFGDVATCAAMARRLRAAGVDEVAGLIDFGVDDELVLAGLELLADVQATVRDAEAATPVTAGAREAT